MATWILFGKLIGVATFVGFGKKRCRKNLPLADLVALCYSGGTIRGDFSSSRQMNLVHASDSPESATREIDLYFEEADLCPYVPTLTPWLKAGDEA